MKMRSTSHSVTSGANAAVWSIEFASAHMASPRDYFF
jgi:hypothetical protein